MKFQKLLARLLIGVLLFQNFFFLPSGSLSAAPDIDGSANIDLMLTPSLPATTIIGESFVLDIALENKLTSDGDAYRPGFILSLPSGISLISAGRLGTPTRTLVHGSGNTLHFFQMTNEVVLKGLTTRYPITLGSSNAAGVFVLRNIGILGYVDDNIYGRGSAPVGAPPATLTGGIDYASGSGVSMPDPVNLTFPANVNSSTNLSTLPFISPSIQFTPFDIRKEESGSALIGNAITTTLTVLGNSMGSLRHFHLQDIIPANRAFSGFLSVTGATIGGIHITYDAPSPGFVTLDITDITVPANTNVSIVYQTLPLAYEIASYSGSTPILDTGSIVGHDDPSPNTVTMHTGSLALVGGPYAPTTWNNGTSDILVNASSMLPPRSVNTPHKFANLSKSASTAEAEIDDIITYTITLDTAKNVAFTPNGSGTYITDILPDGMTYSGMLSSTLSGVGLPFTFISTNTNIDGETTLIWRLNSGTIGADSRATIQYQARVDGLYEGVGDIQYENTEALINRASLYGTIGDGGLSGLWGETDPTLIDSVITIDDITASIYAPIPSTKKHLISVTTPTGTVYDYTTGLPANIPTGSALKFAVTMDFPNVNFINPKIIDALPLLAGPNTNVYDISFQTDPSLRDIYNSGVLFNTNDGVTPAGSFNGLNLIGTTIPNAAWVVTNPANNIEFHLNSGIGKKTFALVFTVDVLPVKPTGGPGVGGLVPLTNFAYSSFSDDGAGLNPLPVMDIPFNVNFPVVTATKTASGGTNVAATKMVDYTVTLINTGSSPAFLENIIDTLPLNIDLLSSSIVQSGSLVPIPHSIISQSGNILSISFNTGALSGTRSLIPLDDIGTPSIAENIIVIRYSVVPNTNFVIQGGATRANTVRLDYYASSGALSNGVNNLGPVMATANISVASPNLARSIFSTTETDSIGSDLYVGEEVVYRTIITLPQGTFSLAQYAETINANLHFISGAVVASSGALTFSSGTTFSGAIVPFGTITNSDTDMSTLETVVIETTYRVRNTANPGTGYANNGTFTYSSTSVASSLNVNVRRPVLTLTKSVSPLSADAGDTLTYTITANNTSTTARAYDIRITDILPSNITYITGSLSVGSFSGSELNLFTSSGGGNGLSLDVLPTASGASFSFQAIVDNALRPADIRINRADVLYSSLDDDNSPYEWSGATLATALMTVPDITLAHTILSTDLSDTSSSIFSGSLVDIAIGERVVYQTIVTFPETVATGVTFTQTLPVGMKFLSGYILYNGVKSHTLSNMTISPDNVILFSLGDIDNTGVGAGTGFILLTEATLLDYAANTAGSIKNSTLLANYSEKSKSIYISLEVVEPTLSNVKDYSPNTGDAGDTLTTTLTVTNTSLVHAYDVVLTDISAAKLTPDSGFSGTLFLGTLAPGEIRTFSYDNTINALVSPGEILTGTASLVYTSYPGAPLESERNYTTSDTDSVNIITPGSINVELLDTPDVTVGDISEYRVRIPVGEGTTSVLNVESTLPPGMVIIPGSIVITQDSSISYSGTVIPLITPDSDSITPGLPQTVTYSFIDVINTDADNGATEYITLRYDAIVQNSTDISNGDTKSHTAIALYDGGNTKSGASLPVTIREPNLSLTVSNSYTYGYSVPYTFTLTNNGTTTAYDVDVSTLLPVGVTYTGSVIMTNSGGAINFTQVGDSFFIDALPPNTGNPLIFTREGAVAESVPNFSTITLTGTVIYTSQAGMYSTSLANIHNTERSSSGGVDDYIDANKTTSFSLNIAFLNEAISVIDINGGIGIIGDIFEYTLTLVNSGNVLLTGIPVYLDIPAGFTGFTMISAPPGSFDSSNAGSGLYGAGYLSVTGITLPIGESRTIVYRVQALPSVLPGTILSSVAAVGDSVEGALGGLPSVPVTVEAPRLLSTNTEIDINSGDRLLQGEYIRHTITLTNSGTAPASSVSVVLTWNTGSVFVTGSLVFQTGTLVDTGSVFIDVINNSIIFTLPVFPIGTTEFFTFESRASGPIGTSIQSLIEALADEGVDTITLSNILIIEASVAPKGPGGGGGGNTPPSVILPPSILGKNKETPGIKIPGISTPKKKTLVKKTLPQKISIQSEYERYLSLKDRLAVLIAEENTAGVLGITYPKTLPQTGKTLLSRVKKLMNAKLSLEAPRFTQGGENTQDGLGPWLLDLGEIDRNRDEYIVLPSNGMIAPINTVPKESNDFNRLVSGREIDVNTYLKSGVLTYPGTNNTGFGGIGNTVIFGHSSYYTSDSGRYKTHFQKIIELEEGEEIWIYKKQENGEYRRYKYRTEESYEVNPRDTSILSPGIGKNLTLFTCTPIGGITGRWVVQAKYIDEEKSNLEDILYGKLLTTKQKKEIQSYFRTLKSLSLEKKKEHLLQKYNAIALEEKSPQRDYFLLQLAKTYGELR